MTPAWTPQNPPAPDLSSLSISTPQSAPDFPPFNVAQLLKEGTLLLASSGKEYAELVALGTPAEVARARKEAMSRLGLGFMDGMDMDGDDGLDLGKELSQSKAESPEPMDMDSPSTEIKPNPHASSHSPGGTPGELTSSASSPSLSTADLKPTKFLKIKTEIAEPAEAAPESPGGDAAGMSARERNRLKRKLKTGNSAFVPPSSKSAGPSSAPTLPPNKYVLHEVVSASRSKYFHL